MTGRMACRRRWTLRRTVWVWGALAAFTAAGLGGCREEGGTALLCPSACGCPDGFPATCCQRSPAPFCAVAVGCEHSGQCPSGSRCAPLAEGEADALPAEFASCRAVQPGPEGCVLGPPGTLEPGAARALIDGFGVAGYTLVRDDTAVSAAPTYEWDPPEDSVIVSCALFVCPPEVADLGDGAGARIVNYLQCVRLGAVYEPPIGTLDLSQLEPPPCPIREGLPLVTALLAGCWAYDGARVIAATRLVAVRPDEVPGLAGVAELVACSCAAAEDGAPYCARPEGGFGTCEAGRCLRRCVTPADCRVPLPGGGVDAGPTGVADGVDGGPAAPSDAADGTGPAVALPAAGTEEERDVVQPWCWREDGSYVGVCRGEADVSSGRCR